MGYFVEERNGVPPPEKIEFGKEVKEDLNSDPEDDPTHFIAILVESLYMLRKIPEAAEVGFDRFIKLSLSFLLAFLDHADLKIYFLGIKSQNSTRALSYCSQNLTASIGKVHM